MKCKYLDRCVLGISTGVIRILGVRYLKLTKPYINYLKDVESGWLTRDDLLDRGSKHELYHRFVDLEISTSRNRRNLICVVLLKGNRFLCLRSLRFVLLVAFIYISMNQIQRYAQ